MIATATSTIGPTIQHPGPTRALTDSAVPADKPAAEWQTAVEALILGWRRSLSKADYKQAGSQPGESFFHRSGISAERLAASTLKYTLACMTIAIASAQTISNSTFDLRACIL